MTNQVEYEEIVRKDDAIASSDTEINEKMTGPSFTFCQTGKKPDWEDHNPRFHPEDPDERDKICRKTYPKIYERIEEKKNINGGRKKYKRNKSRKSKSRKSRKSRKHRRKSKRHSRR